MQIEFEYTLEDYKEAQRAATKEQLHPRGRVREWIGWVVFIALTGALFILLNKTSKPAVATPPPPPTPPDMMRDLVIPLIPWLLFFGLIWFVVFRQLRGRAKQAWEKQPYLQLRRTFEFTEDRVIMDDVQSRSEMRWTVFSKFVESRNLFLLYHGPYVFNMIPKRAFSGPAEVEAFRRLLQQKIQPGTGAFPVQPVQRP